MFWKKKPARKADPKPKHIRIAPAQPSYLAEAEEQVEERSGYLELSSGDLARMGRAGSNRWDRARAEGDAEEWDDPDYESGGSQVSWLSGGLIDMMFAPFRRVLSQGGMLVPFMVIALVMGFMFLIITGVLGGLFSKLHF